MNLNDLSLLYRWENKIQKFKCALPTKKNKLNQHSHKTKKTLDRTKNGKVGPDCRGHRELRGTTGIPIDVSYKLEQQCTLGIRSVKVKAVIYVFNREGNDFW